MGLMFTLLRLKLSLKNNILKQFVAWQVALLSDNGVQRSVCIWPDPQSPSSKAVYYWQHYAVLVCTILPRNPTRDLAKAMFTDKRLHFAAQIKR